MAINCHCIMLKKKKKIVNRAVYRWFDIVDSERRKEREHVIVMKLKEIISAYHRFEYRLIFTRSSNERKLRHIGNHDVLESFTNAQCPFNYGFQAEF